jgi:hypothetical protein
MKYHNAVIDCLFEHLRNFALSFIFGGLLWAILLWNVLDPTYTLIIWWLAYTRVASKRGGRLL